MQYRYSRSRHIKSVNVPCPVCGGIAYERVGDCDLDSDSILRCLDCDHAATYAELVYASTVATKQQPKTITINVRKPAKGHY